MTRWLMLVLVALWALGPLVAQPDPVNPPPDAAAKERNADVQAQLNRAGWLKAQQTIALTTPQGLFILRNGVLARLDAKTLKTEGVVDLFADDEVPDLQPEPLRDPLLPLYPATLLARETDLLILIGDRFFRLEAATLTIVAKADIAGPFAEDRDRWQELTMPPAVALAGDTLFVTRTTQVASLDVRDGTLLAAGTLPIALQPPKPVAVAPKPAQKAAVPNPPANAPRPLTCVGVLIRVGAEGQELGWVVRTTDKSEYLLEGKALDRLLAMPDIEDSRVRLTGMLRVRDDQPDTVNGCLELTDFQILPR